MSALPGILGEIADLVGEEAAIMVADMKGGQTVWLPYELPEDHWLIEAIGLDRALKVNKHFRTHNADERGLTLRLTIPLGPAGVMRRARVKLAELLRAGKRPEEAARLSGLHVRTAYRMQRRIHDRRNSAQQELF